MSMNYVNVHDVYIIMFNWLEHCIISRMRQESSLKPEFGM